MADENNIGSINFTVEAESKGVDKASASMEKMTKSADKVDKSLSKVKLETDKYGNALTKADKAAGRFIDSTGRMREKNGQFVRGLNESNGSLAKFDRLAAAAVADLKNMAIAGAATAGVLGAIAAANSQFNRELEAQARQAGVSVSEYQKLAFAASQAGIEQEKFGDITKDAQDKVGDFLATGGGELADFFENVAPKVGVTADQFRGLSGPAALGLFIQTLEKANVSQEEAIFYTESLADEASRLRGVFGGTGESIAEAGRRMDELGFSIRDIDVNRAAALSSSFGLLATSVKNATTQIVASFDVEIRESLETTIQLINKASKGFLIITDQFRELDRRQSEIGLVSELGKIQAEINRLRSGDFSLTEQIFGDDSEASVSKRVAELFRQMDAIGKRIREIREESADAEITPQAGGSTGVAPSSSAGVADLTDKLAGLERQLEQNVTLYGKTEREVAKVEAREKALLLAREQGVELTTEQQYKIETLIDEYYNLKEAEEAAAKADAIKERIGSLERYEKAWKEAQALHAQGLLTDKELAAYRKKLDEMASTAGDAGEKAGDEFAGGFIDAADLGSALADSLLSGDFGAVGSSIGGSVGDGISKSIGGGFGGSLLGGLAGGIIGSAVTGILSGSKTEQTGTGFTASFNAGDIVNAGITESFKKSSFLRGSREWTSTMNLAVGEMDKFANSIEQSSSAIERGAKDLGISFEDFTGTMESKNGDLSDAVRDFDNALADSMIASIESYQELGQTASEAFAEIASEARTITEGFEITGRGDIQEVAAKWTANFADAITQGYRSELSARQSQLSVVQDSLRRAQEAAANGQRYLDASFSTLLGNRTRTAFAIEQWTKFADSQSKSITELTERIADVTTQAAVEFNKRILNRVAEIEGVSSDAGEQLFEGLIASFFDNYYTQEEQAKLIAEQAKRDFEEIGVAGLSLTSTVDQVKALYQSASNPEQIANILAAADALDRYNDAIAMTGETGEVSTSSVESGFSILNEAFSEFSRSVQAEISGLNESYDSQIDAIRDAANAEQELRDERISSTRDTIGSLTSLQSVVQGGIRSLQPTDEASVMNRATAGVSAISAALEAARSGNFVDAESISAAIEDVSALSDDRFADSKEAVFQQAVAANQLKELDKLVGDQLSTEEKTLQTLESQSELAQQNAEAQIEALEKAREEQVAKLNDQLEEMKSQTESLLGIDSSVKHIADSFDVLSSAILAIDPTASLPGFSSGGYTGGSGAGQIAGVVHGQEYVLNQKATSNIGLSALNAMNSGFNPAEIYGRSDTLDQSLIISQIRAQSDMMSTAYTQIIGIQRDIYSLLDDVNDGASLNVRVLE